MGREIDSDARASSLIVLSDQPENTRWLKVSFERAGLNVLSVDQPEALSQFAGDAFTLVVFDIEPAQLEAAFMKLRANPSMLDAVFLVRAERIPDTATIAGVCPPSRALVCYHDDLVRLIRQHARLDSLPTSDTHHPFM